MTETENQPETNAQNVKERFVPIYSKYDFEEASYDTRVDKYFKWWGISYVILAVAAIIFMVVVKGDEPATLALFNSLISIPMGFFLTTGAIAIIIYQLRKPKWVARQQHLETTNRDALIEWLDTKYGYKFDNDSETLAKLNQAALLETRNITVKTVDNITIGFQQHNPSGITAVVQ